MQSSDVKSVNLALQGGGAHGAVTWGVLDRLLEDDRLEIESISGASAGAVNAVAMTYGLHLDGRVGARRALDELWRAMSEARQAYTAFPFGGLETPFNAAGPDQSLAYMAFDMFTRSLSPYQFNPLGLNPLRVILSKLIDFDELQRCQKVQLFLSATNVRTGKIRVFDTSAVSLDVVLASTCLPFLFQAVKIGEEHYWDGGYMGNPALFPFFYEAKSSDIVIVHVNPIERDTLPVTAPDIMNRINEISFNSSLLRELRAISFVHRLLDEGWLKDEYRDRLRDIRIHSIRSDRALLEYSTASKFNVDWSFLTDLKARGRNIADAWIEETFEQLGARSSVDLRAMFDGGYPS